MQRSQDFIRGSTQRQLRLLRTSAAAAVGLLAVAVLVVAWVIPSLTEPEVTTVTIGVPFVGPGVKAGTDVLLRGAQVGTVSELSGGGSGQPVEVELALDPEAISGLSDDFAIDYRPASYFGITAVNLIQGDGGSTVADGANVVRVPEGDYSMSTMLQKTSLVVSGTLTDSMISSLDKLVLYTDALTPLIESGIVLANQVAQEQTVDPSLLLRKLNRLLSVAPYFVDQTTLTLYNFYNSETNRLADGSYGVDEQLWDDMEAGVQYVLEGVFASVGRLLESHPAELLPVTQAAQSLADAVPSLLDGGQTPGKLAELTDRLSASVTSGTSGTPVLNVELLLRYFPAVGGPLAMASVAGDGGPR